MSDMIITLTLNAAGLKKGVDEAQVKLKTIPDKKETKLGVDGRSMSSAIDKLRSQIVGLAAGTFAVTKVWSAFTGAVNMGIAEARGAAQAQRVLRSQIESTGGAAGYTAEQLTEMSNKLDNLSNFDNDDLLTNLTIPLTTFRNISGEVFEQAQKSILDVAAVLGDPTDPKSLMGTTMQLGKALNDPIRGLTMLNRVGITFSKAQQETIKNLAETNRLAEAQGLILEEVGRQFGGAAESSVDSSTRIKKEWKQLLESLGNETLPVLDGVNLAFANFFEVMASNMDAYSDHQADSAARVFQSWNEFTTAFILNARVMGQVVIHTGSIVTGVLENMFTLPKNAIVTGAQTILKVLNSLPKAVMDAVSIGDLQGLKEVANGIGAGYKKVGTDAKVFVQTLDAEIEAALAGIRSYERDFENITGKSKTNYGKMLDLQKSLNDFMATDETSAATGDSGKAEKAQSEYDKLLEMLKGYHLDVQTETLSARGKELVMLEEKHKDEAAIIAKALAAKEIDQTEADARLLELDKIYGQKSQAILTEIQGEIQADLRAMEQEEIKAGAEAKAKKLMDEETYYNTMQFLDERYVEWKIAQLEKEVAAMALSEDQKKDMLDKMKADLETNMGDNNMDAVGGAAGGQSSWFFGGVLGYDPDSPKDQEKVQAIQATYSHIVSGAQNMVGQLISLSRQRKDEDMMRLDETAAKESWSNERTLAEKKKINKKYEAEERKLRNIQKGIAITQAIINTAEGVTSALKMGPILGPIMAVMIGAMGAVQIALIAAQKFAGGGLFRGKGGTKDDQNIIAVSDQEYIVNAAATKRYLPLLDAINYGSQAGSVVSGMAFAGGGMVRGGNTLEAKLDAIHNDLQVLNLNLVKKKMSVSVTAQTGVQTLIKEIDETRLRMDRRGYVPAV